MARTLFCSFCRRSKEEVPSLIAGPGVFICGLCVESCNAILAGLPAGGFAAWEEMDEETLLANLKRSEQAVEGTSAVLQQQIAELRKREVSWAKIGAALGVTRQSAWERFG